MKKLFISLSLAVALLATSCETDPTNDDSLLGGGKNTENVESPEQEEGANKAVAYLTVGIDNSDTRISLGDEEEGRVPLYWSTGDKLAINRTLESEGIEAEYDGMDTAKIGMSEEVVSSLSYPLVVMYPAEVATGRSEWFYIDSEQAYLQGHLSNGFGILMGKAESEGDVIQMKHMCGYMKVSLTGSATVKKVMLRATGHEPLSGYFRHAENATDIGMSRFNESGLADGYYNSPVICINCDEGVTLSSEATDFYFAIPAGDYPKGFALYVMDSNGNQQRVKAYSSGKTIEAGKMIKMPPLPVNCTEPWGIRNSNEFASFARTLEKNVWLGTDTTIRLHNDFDLTNENFDDVTTSGIVSFRSNHTTYNNDKVTIIDGQKSNSENCVISNLCRTSDADFGLLFGVVRDGLTIQNITLGKTADDPATEEIEADCVLTLTPNETNYTYAGAFAYYLYGTVKNCINKASVIGTVTSSNGLKTGIFSNGHKDSVGTIDSCINYGSIIMDAANIDTTTENFAGGITALNYGTIQNCKNYGAVSISNSSASEMTCVAGITGCSTGESQTTNCENHGSISANNTNSITYTGGVIAYAKTPLTKCSNYGSISITSPQKDFYLGGILGSTTKNGTITGPCHNYGIITSNSATGGVPYVGGIIGLAQSEVSNCHNHNSISITSIQETARIGGVVGKGENTTTNCTNEGALSILSPNAGTRMGGVIGDCYGLVTNCTNTGIITMTDAVGASHIGGVIGTNNWIQTETQTSTDTETGAETSTTVVVATQTLAGCVNGEKDSETKGKISISYKTAKNIYVGGVCGISETVITGDKASANNQTIIATNYAPISVSNAASNRVGGVIGDTTATSILVGYKNYGDITISNAGYSSYSYVGGVSGYSTKNDTHSYCDNNATITIHSPNGKMRAGGIGGYFATADHCNSSGAIYIKEGTATGSEIGGMGGFSNNGIKQYCTIDSIIDNEATGVLVGGLLGSANGSRWYYSCSMKVAITSVDPANTGFASTRAASSGYSIRFGSSGNPFYIDKSSTFLGIKATGIDVFSDQPEEGKINFVTTSTNSNYQLSVNRSNISFID